MSHQTAESIKLITIGMEPKNSKNSKNGNDAIQTLTEKYNNIFGGHGKLNNFQCALQIYEKVKPTIQKPRRLSHQKGDQRRYRRGQIYL